jgi:hypothetical protein
MALATYPVLLWGKRKKRFRSHQAERIFVPEDSRSGFVYCFGCIEEIDPLRSTDWRPKHPVVIPRYHQPVDDSSYGLMLCGITTLAAIASYRHCFLWPLGYLLIMAAIPLAKLFATLIHQIRPVYYRITPSLLEVIRGGFWSDKISVVKRIALDEAYVIIRFERHAALIVSDPAGKKAEEIGLDGLAEPHEFAAALIWGCLVARTGSLPELPASDLLG